MPKQPKRNVVAIVDWIIPKDSDDGMLYAHSLLSDDNKEIVSVVDYIDVHHIHGHRKGLVSQTVKGKNVEKVHKAWVLAQVDSRVTLDSKQQYHMSKELKEAYDARPLYYSDYTPTI